MPIIKKLLLQVSSGENSGTEVVPVNTGKFVDINSNIGIISVAVYIRNFDGSQLHRTNSLYNAGDDHYLNGEVINDQSGQSVGTLPNLRIIIKFSPNVPIKGDDLIFGNDCSTPIRDYVPTTLLSTGLKFFSWFINPTILADIYCESPYIYAPALNSFTTITLLDDPSLRIEEIMSNDQENIFQKNDILKYPNKNYERIKYFCKLSHCEEFVFHDDKEYYFAFDTNFLQLGDSSYSVSIPTFGNRSLDINVLKYANQKLNNFNWTLKSGGKDAIDNGKMGLRLNFTLVDEEIS